MTNLRVRLGLRPVDYFDAAAWPYVQPKDGPIDALYVALLAQRLGEEARKRAQTTNKGFEALARECNVPAATLRHTWAGRRWPSLATLARLEWFLNEPISGYDVANRALRRAEQPALPRPDDQR